MFLPSVCVYDSLDMCNYIYIDIVHACLCACLSALRRVSDLRACDCACLCACGYGERAGANLYAFISMNVRRTRVIDVVLGTMAVITHR